MIHLLKGEIAGLLAGAGLLFLLFGLSALAGANLSIPEGASLALVFAGVVSLVGAVFVILVRPPGTELDA